MKKNIFFIGVSICLLVLLGVGLSYSMWNMSISQDTNNVIATTSECFDVAITSQENAIKLENAYPISDTKGKSLTPFTFTVKNTCDMFASYSVSLESLKESTLSSEFLKVMVNDNEPKILNSLDSTDTVNSGSIESRVLAKGSLSKDSSKDYSVRLWIDYDTTLEDLENEIKILKSKIIIKAIPQGYTGETVFNFDYTGDEQTFTAPFSGTYKLETWGAQGGTFQILEAILSGGYGGYSSGNISLEKENKLYITVGSQGTAGNSYQTATQYIGYGGYNGGGNGGLGLLESEGKYFSSGTGGGGATSIQNILINNGLLKEYKDNIANVILVSGGGGGNGVHSSVGHGGGISGTSSSSRNQEYFVEGATQTTGYEFGIGQDAINQKIYNSVGAEGRGGGGGGFYGGLTYTGDEHDYDDASGSGGSGYIGNPLLTNKVMYCYNCEESTGENTKTISTTCSEETPTENCAKKGNGYARITLISIDE